MTISELLLLSALLLPSAIQTQNSKPPVTTPPPASALAPAPPIKMGLWEATITNSLISKTLKTRSCVTPQSYQQAMARIPPGCTITNKVQTSTSISGDLSCNLQHGGTATGHVDVEMPDAITMSSRVQLSITANGQTTPMTLTTQSHFVSADCGDIAPGQGKMVQ